MRNAKQKTYWKENIAIIRNILIIWALVSIVAGIIFARSLSSVSFFGVNLSFWFAHQGSIIIFVLLILYYARRMDRLDKSYTEKEKE
jgi:putative solute:sodium symporter small subunit